MEALSRISVLVSKLPESHPIQIIIIISDKRRNNITFSSSSSSSRNVSLNLKSNHLCFLNSTISSSSSTCGSPRVLALARRRGLPDEGQEEEEDTLSLSLSQVINLMLSSSSSSFFIFFFII